MGPRLALQLIHEAALCRTGLRHRRTLNQRIFELVNGLPFLASDMAIHELLAARTVADSLRFQVALGKLAAPQAISGAGCWPSIPIACAASASGTCDRTARTVSNGPAKMAQTFFVLDADTCQPLCFTTGTVGAHGRGRSRGIAQVGR